MGQDGKPIISKFKVINYAGAFIALLIGSGFATGQELVQYFASYGYLGMAGAVACFVLLAYVGVSFITAGYRERFDNTNDIYRYYLGNALGTFFDYFSIFFIFLSFTVMIGGASATGVQHYGWGPYTGGALIATLAIITVIFGLNRIVDVIGNIGPVIVVLAIVVGAIAIFKNIGNAATASETMQQMVANDQVKVASSSWWLAAGSYVGFCMLWLAAFLAGVGKEANSEKEAAFGAFGGALGFSVAVIIMSLGLFYAGDKIANTQIPSLIVAAEIHPLVATLYSITIMLGIYTTAVPLMWSVVARFFKEGTTQFKLATAVLAILGAIIGLILKFDQLVNIVYVLNGYVGLVLLAVMIVKSIKDKRI